MERHYGMDWLRIGAFGLLILYHIGMVFVPWGFHVKTAEPLVWTEIPMLATNPWRLTLLFVVSGFASRALFVKSAGVGAFLRNRNARLLVPLAFGIAIIVPPQTWVELVTQHGYAHGFWWFWLHDYFRFGTLAGIVMPTWNHLWFVVYLWAYTLALGLLVMLPGASRRQPLFDRVFGGGRALWLPILFLFVTQFLLFHRDEDTHDLLNDGIAHLQYFPALLFGFGLAGSPVAMAGLARWWKLSSTLALASYALIVTAMLAWPDFRFPSHTIANVFHIARLIEAWAAIAALIGIADRFWNRDHAWRPMLTEAVFPFYIIHQTVIVVVGHAIIGLGLGAGAEFTILVAATVAGCWAFYLIGRSMNWLRPLIGLRRVASQRPSADSAVPKEA